MRWQDFELLEEIGLTLYERKALATVMVQGVADAETLCREGDVPSSKIYQAMEKLARLGLTETQPTRPKLYSALPGDEVVNRLIEISRSNAERFSKQTEKLRAILIDLPQRVRGRKAFVDLALGVESHVKRHLIQLTTARSRIWSYLEHGDLTAIDRLTDTGFPILRRIARNTTERKVDHRVVFGFAYQTASQLVSFLRKHRINMEQVTGVRYSGELGHPFHVVDDDLVILALDHPFIPDGRFASLLVRDKELAQRLAEGFQKLWSKAMRDLREIDFHPGAPTKT
ncbi:MAG TPA: helix-turn-helix domain-containing protein [Candidatus Sulfotelmatobacter sp.]|jgi:sugar-specific transcriptional regulator TrmB|nr:helix-turn-helix domain-containing protein [Candidatus Sulfotelmatobacter sp.]